MALFPPEFSQGLRLPRAAVPVLRGSSDRLRWFPLAIRPALRRNAITLLESHLAAFLRPVGRPVPEESIRGMTRNYSECLPKTVHNSTVFIDNPRTAAGRAAKAIGLTAYLTSKSLHQFAERISGFRLEGDPGLQVIRYRAGDYVGPHNDHHPEEPHLRNGYVDLQITLSTAGVDRQNLLYERGGYLNQSINVGIASGVSISWLPFWHQVTPLEVSKGAEAHASRWLLLVSFVCKQEHPPL